MSTHESQYRPSTRTSPSPQRHDSINFGSQQILESFSENMFSVRSLIFILFFLVRSFTSSEVIPVGTGGGRLRRSGLIRGSQGIVGSSTGWIGCAQVNLSYQYVRVELGKGEAYRVCSRHQRLLGIERLRSCVSDRSEDREGYGRGDRRGICACKQS